MTSIFYVNSMGFLCQWKGAVIAKDDESVTVRFSKHKALKYRLKELGCGFFIATRKLVPPLGLAVDQAAESVCFDELTTAKVLAAVEGNIAERWTAKGWEGAQ